MVVANIPIERCKLISSTGTATVAGVLLDSDQTYLGDFSIAVTDNAVQDLKTLLVAGGSWVNGAAGAIMFSSIPIHVLACKESLPSVANFKARVESISANTSFSVGAVSQ